MSGAFIVKIGAAIIGLLLSIVLARTLGAEGYGAYAFAITWVGVLSIIAQFGFPRVIVRETAIASKKNTWGFVRGLLRLSSSIVLTMSILTSLAAFLIAKNLTSNTHQDLLHAVAFVSLSLPFITATSLFQSALQGIGRIVSGQSPELLVHPFIVLLGISGLYLVLGHKITVTSVLGIQIASSVAVLTLVFYLWRTYRPAGLKSTLPQHDARRWLASAVPLLLLNGTMIINQRADVLMLGILVGAEPVGLYAAASKGSQIVAFVQQAMNVSIAPLLATICAENDLYQLQRLMTRTARFVFLGAITVALPLIILGRNFLTLFGPEFDSSYLPMLILTGAQLINAFTGSVGVLLMMSGHEQLATTSAIIAAIVNIAANMVLIPSFGMEGAALATAISMLTWNALMGYFVHHKLRVTPTAIGLTYRRPEE